jgi:3-hydroxyisobutyrate dehydrogenase-like beta-hydroxyacid dehydrogenase
MAEPNCLGFIGLGVMGGRMCRNLKQKSGKRVIGYDSETGKVSALAAHGVEPAKSLAEVAEPADIVFLCLPGEPQVRDVCLGEDGIVARMREGQALVDMTTATVAVDREVAAACEARGVAFADAPVARGVPAAEAGTLSITVGAEPELFERLQPYLACMGEEISHCGGVGTGQVLKLMNNMVVFETVSTLAEAMAIGSRAGVDPKVLFDTLARGSADSYVLRKHGQHMITGDYPDDQFPITYSLKDLGYALDMAEEVGVDAKGAKLVKERFEAAVARGDGQLYSPAIYKLFQE